MPKKIVKFLFTSKSICNLAPSNDNVKPLAACREHQQVYY